MIALILLVGAFICALLAALRVGTPWFELGWTALALFILAELLRGVPGVH